MIDRMFKKGMIYQYTGNPRDYLPKDIYNFSIDCYADGYCLFPDNKITFDVYKWFPKLKD
jgi:hypothetical protein